MTLNLIRKFFNSNFEFIKGDVTNSKDLSNALESIDIVVHLAAIVGYPACKKFPVLAKSVNFKATELLCSLTNKQIRLFLVQLEVIMVLFLTKFVLRRHH